MKKNDLNGFRDVYQFTIIQTIKSKSFRSFTLVLFIIALLSMPIVALITNSEDKESKASDISKVYVIDETGLPEVDYNSIKEENTQYRELAFEYTNKSADEIEDGILKEDNGSILLHITGDTGFYKMAYVRAPEGRISEMEVIDLSGHIQDAFRASLVMNLGVTADQREKLEELIYTDIQTYTGDTSETEKEDGKFGISFEEYYFALILYVFIMMMISYGGSGIASAIVTEKSTKLIEILLTRISPMAIIVGKVFAMLSVTLIQLLSIGLGFGLSSLSYKFLFNNSGYLPEFILNALELSVLQNITLANIIATIIIYIIGFIFYGFLAGLTGATVSKIEELQEGMIVYTFITIIGAYMALALPMMGIQGSAPSGYAHLVFLLPISSIFITPIYLLFGKISTSIALIAIVILIISTLLVIKFTSKVYQTIILHQGNVIKFKNLISISRTSKEAR